MTVGSLAQWLYHLTDDYYFVTSKTSTVGFEKGLV